MDRTGLTWSRLIDSLLQQHIADPGLRQIVLRQHGEQRAATIACSLYGDGTDAKARITNRIRSDLYGHPKYMAGRMSEHVANLAVTLWQLGESVVIVTPNFDSHLLEDLREQVQPPSGHDFEAVVTHFVAGKDAESELTGRLTEGKILFVSLHGYIPETPGVRDSDPVVSEGDYTVTFDRSRRILELCFQDRNLLVVGSSLTDPPLLRALSETRPVSSKSKPTGPPAAPLERVAVLPLQGAEWRDVPPGLKHAAVQLTRNRLITMGVSALFPDFFIQVGQTVHEIAKCAEHGDPDDYEAFVSQRRYGTRLEQWWRLWLSRIADIRIQQQHDHESLEAVKNEIAHLLRRPAGESLKLEAWVRWRPASERSLALWASSVGTWPDIESMRTDSIRPNSPYRSVEIFCNGAPTFLTSDKEEGTRWRTYLGVPIWYDRSHGSVPVGVISLASMKPEGETAVHIGTQYLGLVMDHMKAVGTRILDPDARPTVDP